MYREIILLDMAETQQAVMLAKCYGPSEVYDGWWWSEKLDGVRGIWTGERFISRMGKPFVVPEWFTEGLPRNEQLDGELFAGRGNFQKCVSIVRRRQDGNDGWRDIRYCVFDVCTPNRRNESFEDRAALGQRLIEKAPWAKWHIHNVKLTSESINEILAKVESDGGEGIMLRRPGSAYASGRSGDLLKVKSFSDEEAQVIGHVEGKGKHAGKLGALLCVGSTGERFKIGTGFSDAERADPPKIGSCVTYRFQEKTRGGIPRFPVFMRIRQHLGDDVDQ